MADTENTNQSQTEATVQPPNAIEVPDYLAEHLRGLNVTLEEVKQGNTGPLIAQLSMARGNIEAALAKAHDLGISTTGVSTQDIDALIAAGDTVDPAALARMVENATRAAADGDKLIAEVQVAEFGQGMGKLVGGALAGGALLSSDVFHESVAALKTGDFSSLKERMSEITHSGQGIMKSLNSLEASPSGPPVSNVAAMPEQFIPQEGLPNLGPSQGIARG